MDKGDLEVSARRTVFQGYFRMDEWRLRHRLFEGGWSAEVTRECLERGHAVAVLPYDPVRDEVVLIEQFRVGAAASAPSPNWDGAPPSPWLIEIVAGIVEDGEQPHEVAARETLEECGRELLALKPITSYLVTPGCSSETLKLYLGRVDATDAGGIHGLDHEHEDIRVFAVPAEDAFRMVANGTVNNGTAIITLQWLQLNHKAVRREWSA
ncbi:MAG: ADP-ribose diphosphatase [Rhodospirillales bacterium CG15_BIG_FIL_POST_REV_8_21_14_020_66_15]|nr:MAG: ADP-ribose diphosphatase [Rhodospirillales bacterium CG15_BIG_FIL_POST_REV_8_21_14_020_66_15]